MGICFQKEEEEAPEHCIAMLKIEKGCCLETQQRLFEQWNLVDERTQRDELTPEIQRIKKRIEICNQFLSILNEAVQQKYQTQVANVVTKATRNLIVKNNSRNKDLKTHQNVQTVATSIVTENDKMTEMMHALQETREEVTSNSVDHETIQDEITLWNQTKVEKTNIRSVRERKEIESKQEKVVISGDLLRHGARKDRAMTSVGQSVSIN